MKFQRVSKINLSRVTFYPVMVVSIFITRTKRDKKDLSTVFGLSILSLLRQTFINPLSPYVHKQILQTDLHTFL